MTKRIKCDIGIMAYNEGKNIGYLLGALLRQELVNVKIENIFVVADGCTDNTVKIAEKFREKDGRIKILAQKERGGKAVAINTFLKNAKNDILIMESADTIPEKSAVEKLVSPFKNSKIGMTGAHPVPVDKPDTFMGFVSHLIWNLHHQVSLKSPKMGELVAFKKIFNEIPRDSIADEVDMELIIISNGYQLHYVPEAIVYNKGTENIVDFLRQRKRIYAGHLEVKQRRNYTVSTMNGLKILFILLKNFKINIRNMLLTSVAILLEICARVLGWYDFCFRKKNHILWDIAKSTKKLNPQIKD